MPEGVAFFGTDVSRLGRDDKTNVIVACLTEILPRLEDFLDGLMDAPAAMDEEYRAVRVRLAELVARSMVGPMVPERNLMGLTANDRKLVIDQQSLDAVLYLSRLMLGSKEETSD